MSDGTQAGLNPALIYLGDVTLQRIVTAIKASPTWSNGASAIIAVWDENDYSLAPNVNRVLLIVAPDAQFARGALERVHGHGWKGLVGLSGDANRVLVADFSPAAAVWDTASGAPKRSAPRATARS